MSRVTLFLIVSFFLVCSVSAQQQSPLPELPSDIPKDAVIRTVLSETTPSGQDAVWKAPDGTIHEFLQYNDRGRGPKIYTTYRLDADGLITSEESKGVDYMKNPIEEHFSLVDGKAAWKNQSEDEKQESANGKFFIGLNQGLNQSPESFAILARALLISKNNGKLLVLPSGAATIRKLQSVPVEADGKKQTVTLYEIGGLEFTPRYIWLDEQEQFFAIVSGWSSTIRKDFETRAPVLLESQRPMWLARSAELAKKLTVKPESDVVIRNVTVFDSNSGNLLTNQRVTVRGQRIVGLEPDQGQPIPPTSQLIDGRGKMLLPGLWDMHAHLGGGNAFLDIAFGVTTAREVDPTMGVWESTYESRPGEVPKLDAPIFDRLPVQVQRGIKSGGNALPVSDQQTDKLYRASYANMVRMLKLLYDSGVQIVAGTDAFSGYAFHRELEIYNESGIPTSEVLRIATIEAATVMHKDQDFGSISPGKYADMILINGDPTKRISDIRRIDLVIKNGEIYTPAEMYPAFGIRAQ